MFITIPLGVFAALLAAPFFSRGMIPAAALDRESHKFGLDIFAFKLSISFTTVMLGAPALLSSGLGAGIAAAAVALTISIFVALYIRALALRWH